MYKNLQAAIAGTSAPHEIIETLALVSVEYLNFEGQKQVGQLVVHKDVVKDLQEIFEILLNNKFPINKIVPIVAYNWDDDASIMDNNTSSFNYRFVKNTTRLSNHSYGKAIDINPKLNPYIDVYGKSRPGGGILTYEPNKPGTIVNDSVVVDAFLSRGWEWAGHWQQTRGYADYQHFQKLEST